MVEPLRVVDDAQQGFVPSAAAAIRLSTASPTRKRSGRRSDAAAEGHRQRLALRFRQFIDVIHQRRAQLLQAGERELHIGLNACHVD